VKAVVAIIYKMMRVCKSSHVPHKGRRKNTLTPTEGVFSMQFQCIELYLLLQKVRVLMEKMRGKIMIHGHITDLQVSNIVMSTWLCSL
jgi:hypothetical protein